MQQPRSGVIQSETVMRMRNSFARVALETLAVPSSDGANNDWVPPFSTKTESDWLAAVTLWRRHSVELMATVPDRPCPGCGGRASRELFESYDAHLFHECDSCGCWFVPKHVDPAVFEALFSRSPEAHALAVSTRAGDLQEQRDANLARIGRYLDDLLPLLPETRARRRAYLDTACGAGHSLRAGRARGLTVQGVEVNRAAIELARKDGLAVAAFGEPIPVGPYRLISFWETLEHLADPLETMQGFLPYLADDGLVAITVPNLNALETRTLREACSWVFGGYNAPGHVNLFHPPAIRQLLDRAGLTVLEVDGECSGNPEHLAAGLVGATRGAFDALKPASAGVTLPARLVDLLLDVWPGAALLERLTLTTPLLFVVACRKGREAQFAPAMSARRQRRSDAVIAEARALIAQETDFKAIAAHLEAEVTRQAAVMTALQDEVNLRDRLLEEERSRFARSIVGRLLGLAHRGRRVARRLGIYP